MIDKNLIDTIVQEANKPPCREELIAQARKFLYDNQECFVSQWVIQNPFADIGQYRLKFQYNDSTLMGYTVEMEKIYE